MDSHPAPRPEPQLPLFPVSRGGSPKSPVSSDLLAAAPADLRQAIQWYCEELRDRGRAVHTVRSTWLDLAGLAEQLGPTELWNIGVPQLKSHLVWLQTTRLNR